MTIKKTYEIGDNVWVYGITIENKITKGKVIANIDLSTQGYEDLHYIISIPTHIEPLLEIRTWHTMSQDEHGPIGSLRNLGDIQNYNDKKMRQIGYVHSSNLESDSDPSPDQIMAALQKSANSIVHKPLNLKDNKPKRKYYPRKKKL